MRVLVQRVARAAVRVDGGTVASIGPGLLLFVAFMTGPETAVELPHGYTYSAHPLACAAGLGTLKVYEEEGLLTRVGTLEKYWEDAAHSLKDCPNVVAIKIAPFNRYQTLDVVRALLEAGRDDVALYTGNDDTIVTDLLTHFSFGTGSRHAPRRIVGGLLGHWGVWNLNLEPCPRTHPIGLSNTLAIDLHEP